MTAAEVREALERTGVLFTQHDDDPGHISPFWRKRIEELCSTLESTPLDAADLLRAEQAAHDGTRAALRDADEEIARLQTRIESTLEAKAVAEAARQSALRLVEDAVPRMRTLNNAMSPGWLARADELLGT